jgi:hypothetical protein
MVEALGGALSPRDIAEVENAYTQKKAEEEESEAKHDLVVEELETAMNGKDLNKVRDAAANARALLVDADQRTRDPGSPQTLTAGRLAKLARMTTHVEAELKRARGRELQKAKKLADQESAAQGKRPNYKMKQSELWQYVQDGNVGMVRSGIKAFLSPLGRNDRGLTMIHVACQDLLPQKSQECVSIIKILLEGKAEPNLRTFEGLTPLDIAASHGSAADAAIDQLKNLGFSTGSESPSLRQTARRITHGSVSNPWMAESPTRNSSSQSNAFRLPDGTPKGLAQSSESIPEGTSQFPLGTPGTTPKSTGQETPEGTLKSARDVEIHDSALKSEALELEEV